MHLWARSRLHVLLQIATPLARVMSQARLGEVRVVLVDVRGAGDVHGHVGDDALTLPARVPPATGLAGRGARVQR